MDTENKSIIKNTNIPLLITGVIAAIAACIFTAVTYPLMYDIHETAARILMILPPVFCAIFSLILYKNGSSAVTRELSALVFATGIAASVLLFKAFCGDNEMFYYSYGALPYLFPLAALAVLIIFDCIVPFVIYDSLVIVYCTTVFVSEYTTLLIPAALIALIPAYCYAIIKSGKNDYRKYLTRILLAAAILLAVFAYIELSVTVPVAVAVIVAAIFVFKKFKIEKTDFTIGIKQTLTAAVCSVCILSVILGFQIYYSYHLDRIRSQSVRADYEIEKLEIDKDKISVTLKAEKPNENNQYSGEKYALIRPNDDDDEKFYIERYSETEYSRKPAFVLAEYLNGKPITCRTDYDKKDAFAKAAGVYDGDDWNSAHVFVSINYEGCPIVYSWSFVITGNNVLEDLFENDS